MEGKGKGSKERDTQKKRKLEESKGRKAECNGWKRKEKKGIG